MTIVSIEHKNSFFGHNFLPMCEDQTYWILCMLQMEAGFCKTVFSIKASFGPKKKHGHYAQSRDMYSMDTMDSSETCTLWTLGTIQRHVHWGLYGQFRDIHVHYGQSRDMYTMDSPETSLWTVQRHVYYGQSREMYTIDTMDSPETYTLLTVQRHVHYGHYGQSRDMYTLDAILIRSGRWRGEKKIMH